MVGEEEVLSALRKVVDPELSRDVVSLGMIKDVGIHDGCQVGLTLELTTPACLFARELETSVREAVRQVPGVTDVSVKVTSRVASSKAVSMIPGVKNIVAVASGKGGVGKSTISVNVAVALAQTGSKVGILDADVYGPNIPLMIGANERPRIVNGRLIPPMSQGVKVMSLGFFYPDESALIWRGPLVAGAIRQLLKDVDWGDLDYLIVDLPPGTGDVPLTLSQTIPLTGVIIVTTPQDAALSIATKAIAMFRKLNVSVLGIVENMSYFQCPHCGKRTDVFSHGGAKEASETLGVPFLGEVSLDVEIRRRTDSGMPIVLSAPELPSASALRNIAKAAAGQVITLARHSTLA